MNLTERLNALESSRFRKKKIEVSLVGLPQNVRPSSFVQCLKQQRIILGILFRDL